MNNIALYPTPPALRVAKPRWPKLGRLTAVGVSILTHALFFIYFSSAFFEDGGLQTQHGPIRVHLQPAPVPAPVPELQAMPTTAETPRKLQTKPPAPPRPAAVKSVSPAPLLTAQRPLDIPPTTPAETAVATSESQNELPDELLDELQLDTSKATAPATTPMVTATPAVISNEQRQRIKQHYLATLMAHIESRKHYPRAARQRRIEGQTTVRFTLLASGQICDISVNNGPKLLRIASKAALQRALPLPKPPDSLDFPLSIQFNMEYRLI